ncbi:DUF3558 domain-containing protein [Nocardia carnea]|uniref:DUF3558 domain-containing protein n=1 Tax=Nocardia carnea TaxID=37328 RepID=UPI002457B690|nr:DUF3558 domain-containing protein [Nocardia carnea]
MISTRKFTATVAVAVAVVFVGGCSRDGDGDENGVPVTEPTTAASVPPARPTLTESKLQPPPQQNEYTTQGRPEVVFDPCTWISDDAATAAGMDPESRRRGRDWVVEYTFLTCDFDGTHRDLQINSGNVTWDEDVQKNGAFSEPTTVNGREALLVQDPEMPDTCSMHVRTKVGLVMFTSVRTFEGIQAGLQRCDGVREIAEALEPEIGEEN